jgi:hypothetical protein
MPLTTQNEVLLESGQAGAIIDEIAYEVRCWDTDRDLTHAQLALRIFELVRGNEAWIAARDCPDLWRQIPAKV